MIDDIRKNIKMNDFSNDDSPSDLIEASILILLYENQDGILSTILQKRSQKVHHPGEIGFPGGRYEETDIDLAYTAMRETEEEIGVAKNTIEIIGNLHPTTTRMGYLMHTYVGYSTKKALEFTMLEDEVERLIEIPVSHLFDPVNQALITWQGQSRLLSQLGFRVEDELIFGATARVINEFINLVRHK